MPLNGVPLSIISNRGSQFKYWFWRSFQRGLGTQVKLSTALHPKTDCLEDCTIKTLKDILRSCIIYFNGNWVDHFPLVEFSYNNSFR